MVWNKNRVWPNGLYDFRVNDDVPSSALNLHEIAICNAVLFSQSGEFRKMVVRFDRRVRRFGASGFPREIEKQRGRS